MPRLVRVLAQLCGVAVVLVVGWIAGSALDHHRTAPADRPATGARLPTRSLPSLRVLAELEPPARAASGGAVEPKPKRRSERRSSRADGKDGARSSRRSRSRPSRASARRVRRHTVRRSQAARPVTTPAPPVVQAAPPVVTPAPAPPPPAPTPPPASPPPAASPPAPKPAAPTPAKPQVAVAFDDSA